MSSGIYMENITVDRRVNITGADDDGYPVIDAGGNGDAVRLLANGVLLKGLIITGSSPNGSGVKIDSGGNRIERCSIYNNGDGINATGQADNTVTGCDIYNNSKSGITLDGCRDTAVAANHIFECPAGISLRQSVNITVRDNNASDNFLYGIRLQGSDENAVIDNRAYDNGEESIEITNGSDRNVISHNDIDFDTSTDTKPGKNAAIDVFNSRDNAITGNHIMAKDDAGSRSARSTSGSDGIRLTATGGCTVENNVVTGGRYGVSLSRSNNYSATGNSVSGGYYGIAVEGSETGTVADNVLEDADVSLWIKDSDHNVIRNNTMSGAGLADDSGYLLALSGAWNNIIEDNTLASSPRVRNSIWLSNSSYNTLHGNRDENSGGNGIRLADGSTGNRAYLNDFLGQADQVSSGNYWSSQGKLTYMYHGKTFTSYLGNLWPGFLSSDVGGNGVGDTGYRSSSVTDKYPLMESLVNYDLDPSAPEVLPYSGTYIGFHESQYGIGIWPFPSPEAWYDTGKTAADKFSGSTIGAVWVIGCARSDGSCFLNFPSSKQYPEIRFTNTDENEAYLDYFDSKGMAVILQVEPGNANVADLIRLVLDRYSHHPCVAGLGIDLEWYRFSSQWQGIPVTDQVANDWYSQISSYNQSYVLALTHWIAEKMPPTYRKGVYFLYDAYRFNSFQDMMDHSIAWGKTFPDSPVGFYIGFQDDRNWWGAYTDPYETIGQSLLDNIDNTKAIFWINGQYPRT